MSQSKPHIVLSSLDMDRIEALLEKNQTPFPGRDVLEAELDRADVLDPKDMPPNVVTMNSTVRFTMLETGKTSTLTLVYPKEMDGSDSKVSIFAPVGIALLGLAVGDELQMPSATGKVTTVRVDAIDYQPENAGELHR
ncbi:nucleoside diphosphate kinase regulator [Oryzisolibacter sp. LB2S]|uniref:nucleoside diphosphate kinase regulator n=1 Tax=Alicycliphilus soli TaxID=3228789 RepID=UPI00345A08F9